MPPKKGKKDGADSADEDSTVLTLLRERDMDITVLREKTDRLQEWSHQVVKRIEDQYASEAETNEKLQDVIACLTSEVKVEHEKGTELDETLQGLKAERAKTVGGLIKEITDLKNTHKFVTEDLRLQLANAQVQLRDIDDFRAKKAAIEQEVARLKDQLEREKKDHQDAVGDIERATLKEKEKLKKEMIFRIEETKLQMLQQMDDQIHAKTKRTIQENEQLSKELSYHIRQTELLLHINEKLVQENVDLHRRVLLAKEVEEDLARRNQTSQRTVRLILFKLREVYLAQKPENDCEMEAKKIKSPLEMKNKGDSKVTYEELGNCEYPDSLDEAMKFLYCCVEGHENQNQVIESIDHLVRPDLNPDLNISMLISSSTSLDKLTFEHRQELLLHLLQVSVAWQSINQNVSSGNSGEQETSIKDMPKEELKVYGHSDSYVGCKKTSISIGVQTEATGTNWKI